MPIRAEEKHRYPSDWPVISKRIRERANWRCEFIDASTGERCTAKNGEKHPITGSRVVLTVAHLNHEPPDVSESNLLAGCQRCHLAYDAAHHRKTRERSRREALKTGEIFGPES